MGQHMHHCMHAGSGAEVLGGQHRRTSGGVHAGCSSARVLWVCARARPLYRCAQRMQAGICRRLRLQRASWYAVSQCFHIITYHSNAEETLCWPTSADCSVSFAQFLPALVICDVQATAPLGQLQSTAVISLHGGPPLRILLTANVGELEVRLSTDVLDFGCVRAGCCKVRCFPLENHRAAQTFGPSNACLIPPSQTMSMCNGIPCVACVMLKARTSTQACLPAGGTCGSEQSAAGGSRVGAGSVARFAKRLLLPRCSVRGDASARTVRFRAGVIFLQEVQSWQPSQNKATILQAMH